MPSVRPCSARAQHEVERERPRLLPADQPLALREPPRDHEDQRHREVGRGVDEHARACSWRPRRAPGTPRRRRCRSPPRRSRRPAAQGRPRPAALRRRGRAASSRGRRRRRPRPASSSRVSARSCGDTQVSCAACSRSRAGAGMRRDDHDRLTARPTEQQLAHGRERRLEVLQRVGVRQAQVALAVGAEGGAGEHGDAGLVEQAVGEVLGVQAGRADVGEGVEGALRLDAARRRASR